MASILDSLRTAPEGYEAWHAQASSWWQQDVRRARALGRACVAFKYACYALYPTLVVWLAWEWFCASGSLGEVLRAVLIPGVGFVLVSAVRGRIDAPRPYEACGLNQLISKNMRGSSFPSRHVFSIVVIGMCWLHACAPVGAAILAAGVVMAYARVMGGVHYPRDVVCAYALGVLFGLGLWL